MSRILVTGGAGFLGSHLCEKLVDEKNDVICVDNLFTGSKANIKHLFSNPFFEFIRHEIRSWTLGNAYLFKRMTEVTPCPIL